MVCNLKNMVVVAAAVAACSESSWSSEVGVAMSPVAALTMRKITRRDDNNDVAPARSKYSYYTFPTKDMRDFLNKNSKITCLDTLKKKTDIYDKHREQGKSVEQIKTFFLFVQSQYERIESFGITNKAGDGLFLLKFTEECSKEFRTEDQVRRIANKALWSKLEFSSLSVTDTEESPEFSAWKKSALKKFLMNESPSGVEWDAKMKELRPAKDDNSQKRKEFEDEILGSVELVCSDAEKEKFYKNLATDGARRASRDYLGFDSLEDEDETAHRFAWLGLKNRKGKTAKELYRNRDDLFATLRVVQKLYRTREHQILGKKEVDNLTERVKAALEKSKNFLVTGSATPDEYAKVQALVKPVHTKLFTKILKLADAGLLPREVVDLATPVQQGRRLTFGVDASLVFNQNADDADDESKMLNGILGSHNSGPNGSTRVM